MDEYLQIEHHIYSNQIKEALKIVEDYIKKNDLILVGGQAIDYSLKTKGSYIYDEYTTPDYDAISPYFYKHAKNVSKILCKKEFPDVSTITAVHNTTVRVKVSNYTVFDSTYCPKDVYCNIKTLKYLGLNIIHPHYQIIDQYNSLSFLFEQTGASQNIYHRMEKDICRNKLLSDYFPIISTEKPKKITSIKLPISLLSATQFKSIKHNKQSYIESIDDICCHGFLGYSIYYQSIYDLYEKNKYFIDKKDKIEIDKLFNNCLPLSFNIKDTFCNFEIPENESITFINGNNNIINIQNNINKLFKITKEDTYNKLLEIKPISKIYNTTDFNFEIFDLSGRLVSCNIFHYDEHSIIVSNYNYLLSYFLMKYFYYNKNYYYLTYYLSLLNIIKIAKILSNNKKIKSELLNNFTYSISTYGAFNYPESFYYFIYNFDYMMINNKNSDDKPTKLYLQFPDCDTDAEFDESKSLFFNINGQLNNKLIYTNYLHLLKKNN